MVTIPEARDMGFTFPGGDDLISKGDDAIQINALAAATGIDAARFAKKPPAPFDFDTWKAPIVTTLGSGFPAGWTNVPEGITTACVFICYSSPSASWCVQELIQYGSNPIRLWRVSRTTAEWNPWVQIGGGGDVSSAMGGNAARQSQFVSATGGPVRTGGKAAFALRLDHGWTNIKSLLRTELIARGIVPGVASCSRQWDLDENSGATIAEVKSWVANGEFEILNQGATHGQAMINYVDEIVNGRAELEDQLDTNVWGFAPPGGSVDWEDFGGGSVNGWASLPAGIALASHAYSMGYVGGARRVLDGTIRQGLSHITLDTYDMAQARAQVDAAIAERRGIQVMLHPRELDKAGKITTAEFLSFLDYVVGKRDAGDLVILSPGELVRADATPPPAWGEVTGKPSTYTPAAHTHAQADVTGLVSALAGLRPVAPMVIAQGTNLNDVTTPGEHSQQFSSWATPELNYPGGASPVAGRLIVAANTGRTQVTQFYIPFTTSKLDIWMRNYYSTWSPWERIGMASDLALKANTSDPALYKSGMRNVTRTLLAGWAGSTFGVRLSRQGATVTLALDVTSVGIGSGIIEILPIPAGFQPIMPGFIQPARSAGPSNATGWYERISTSGPLRIRLDSGSTLSDGQRLTNVITWQTVDAIPSTLPGTPA